MSSMPQVKPAIKRSGATLAVLICVVVLAIGYSLHERSVAQQSAAQNAQLSAALQQTHGDIEALTARLNSMTPPAQELKVDAPKPSAVSGKHEKTASVRIHSQAMHIRRKADDPRWKKFQSQLDEQGREIESTRGDLASAKTELSGSIARTHDELVLLQKRGERNYYEFDISKSDQFRRNGPLAVRLRKANVKHQYADLQLRIDDAEVTRKHVNIFEPVMFYAADGVQPAELVINSITKDHIRGYVSEPKYRRSELAAMSGGQKPSDTTAESAAPSESPSSSMTATRKKLPPPQ